MLRKLVVEAVGTFFLVFTIGQVVIDPGAGQMVPLAIGSVLMAMVYAGGHVSGAHYNPAVTLAVLVRGLVTLNEAVGYWIAQLVAALLAAGVVAYLKGAPAAAPFEPPVAPAMLAEFLFTFALAFVVLNVATAAGTKGNSYFGLAIGFTVLAAAYAVGGVSGAVLNPAVAAGLVGMGSLAADRLWTYLIAEVAGGAAAALLFNAMHLGDDEPTTATPANQAGPVPPAEP